MPDQPRPPKNVPEALAGGLAGPTWFADEFAMPFLSEAADALREDGFAELAGTRAAFALPEGWFETTEPEPIAVVGGVPEAIALAVFLGASVGSWAIGRICDAIWEERVRPALRRLFEMREADEHARNRPVTVRFGAWFDTDGVFVEAIADVGAGEDSSVVEDLVPEAFRRALLWVEQHGVSRPALTYRIRHGQLSEFPRLSDKPESA